MYSQIIHIIIYKSSHPLGVKLTTLTGKLRDIYMTIVKVRDGQSKIADHYSISWNILEAHSIGKSHFYASEPETRVP